jgi:signal peptidase I
MTFDFSAWLLLFTVISGLVLVYDRYMLAPARRQQALDAADNPALREPWPVEYARSFFPVFLIVLILRSFIVEPFRIPSASMMPTLLIGDFILVNKYDYGIRLPVINTRIIANNDPARGDIVVFRYPEDPSIPFIKRVVGVPGDHVEYRNKTIYINGVEQIQTSKGDYEGSGAGMLADGDLWLSEKFDDNTHDILIAREGRYGMEFETTVPEGNYFVLGDNRDNSRDSRYWGFVPDANLVGRAFYIWMNWDNQRNFINWIGWDRIGTILE